MLAQFGWSAAEIQTLGQQFASLPDSVYHKTAQIPTTMTQALAAMDRESAVLGQAAGHSRIATVTASPDTLFPAQPPGMLTCWLEFPPDSVLNGYHVVSATLNDTLQATAIASNPMDHDDDGIQDFAIEFNGPQVASILSAGERQLCVSGRLATPSADTLFYAGAAVAQVLVSTAVPPQEQGLTAGIRTILQSRPNPFSRETSISFGLAGAAHVTLEVYSVSGRRVARLVDEQMPAGVHSVKWDGRDTKGVAVSPGVYMIHLQAGSLAQTMKITILK